MDQFEDMISPIPDGASGYQLGGTWASSATDAGPLSQGDGLTLTWSIVPDGTFIDDAQAQNSNLVSFLDGILGAGPGGSDLTQRPWFSIFVDAFDRWNELSGVTFVYEAVDDGAAQSGASTGVLGVRGDMRIAGRFIDGPFNTLAFNYGPGNGDMVIDTGDAAFYSNTANNSRAFRNTLMHEFGHGLGFGHVFPQDGSKLMEPTNSTLFDGPQLDDILAVQRGYGDANEKMGGNGTAASAPDTGGWSNTLIAQQLHCQLRHQWR